MTSAGNLGVYHVTATNRFKPSWVIRCHIRAASYSAAERMVTEKLLSQYGEPHNNWDWVIKTLEEPKR